MSGPSLATLEQLRLLPEGDRIELLRTRREDQWFERIPEALPGDAPYQPA